MPQILEDSPASLSPFLKPVQPSARQLDSAASADGDLTDQENEMPSNKPQKKIQSESAAGLEDLAFGKLSLSDGPKKPLCDAGGLEDSDSEQAGQVNAQAQSCLVDSDVSDDEAVAPPCRTPLEKLGALDGDVSGSDDEEVEEPGDEAEDQKAGAEPLQLRAEDGMEFSLEAGLHDALYCHQVAALKWLWGMWVDGKGGILGDDMGLGKTRTMCSFLSGLAPESAAASIRRPPAGGKRFRRALIVVPTTLMDTWITELGRVGVGVNTVRYHGTKKQRERLRTRLFSGIKVAVTTYETVLNDTDALSSCSNNAFFPEDRNDETPAWDIVILDEGHKVKNASSKTYQALYDLPARMRVVVTGTPMQNNLMEMHALLDLACPGLLPGRKEFKAESANVIEAGQDKNAPSYVKHKGKQRAEELHALFDPYLLRRCKATTKLITVAAARDAAASETSQQGASAEDASLSCASAANPEVPALPGKTDLVVWLQMHPVQRKAYQGFLQSSEVSSVLNQTSSALAAISVLKKICDHPALLNDRKLLKAVRMPPKLRGKHDAPGNLPKAHQKVLIDGDNSDDEFAQPGQASSHPRRAVSDSEDSEGECDRGSLSDFVVDDSECESSNDEEEDEAQVQSESGSGASQAETQASSGDWGSLDSQNLMKRLKDMHIEDSCKTVFTLNLLEKLAATGHRTLVFAQSLGMLDMLQRALRRKGVKVLRMDGQSAAVKDRQKIVERFQRKKSIPVFLLSAQVGGLGLTITAADRVIILDPSWNPAVDCQSVDRAFRIGQKRHVVVYRLITCGTVEEKIYRRQVFKGGLAKATIEKANPIKYFSEVELRELFSLDVNALNHSHTAEELHKHHAADRTYDDDITSHVASLTDLEYAVDTSDHSVLFSRVDDTELGPTAPQERPRQLQSACSDTASAASSRQPAIPSALGSMVPADVKPPSAEALMHKKLLKKAGALEERITELTAALAATNGGSMLKDKGAKLHCGLQAAKEELVATRTSLNELTASQGTRSEAYVAHSGGSSVNHQADALADLLEQTGLK